MRLISVRTISLARVRVSREQQRGLVRYGVVGETSSLVITKIHDFGRRQPLVAVLIAHVVETHSQRVFDWFEYRVVVLPTLQIRDLQAVNLRLATPHEVIVDVEHRVARLLLADGYRYNNQSEVFPELTHRLSPVKFNCEEQEVM